MSILLLLAADAHRHDVGVDAVVLVGVAAVIAVVANCYACCWW